MADTKLEVRHIYTHQAEEFEALVNAALREIVEEKDAVIGDIKYSIDPSTEQNSRGGYGALIIYELEVNG